MDQDTIYDDLGVPPVINATGTKTRIGGSQIREEAIEAMNRAAKAFVRVSDLQAKASERIAEAMGADAGYVTSGGAAALALGTAACLAGDDIRAMAQLPETGGIPDEVIMPRTHRTGYDHAIHTAGATIVDIGTNDSHLGTGSRNVEPWEIAAAITEKTAAVAYLQKPYTQPPLETVVEIAHEHDVPVLVDAAAELPPTANLEALIGAGADLVAFSGGKAIRGPQTTGILAGRADLIQSVAAQHLDMHAAEEVWEPPTELLDPAQLGGVPRQGLGRPMKVGKEELVGLIRALECFIAEDQDELRKEWLARTAAVADELEDTPGITTLTTQGEKTTVTPEVVVRVDAKHAGISATNIVSALRRENPRVFVGADSLPESKFTINPMCLTDDESMYVVDRVRAQIET